MDWWSFLDCARSAEFVVLAGAFEIAKKPSDRCRLLRTFVGGVKRTEGRLVCLLHKKGVVYQNDVLRSWEL